MVNPHEQQIVTFGVVLFRWTWAKTV